MDVVISQSRERLFGAEGAIDFSVLSAQLNRALQGSIARRRWFGGKARTIRDLTTIEFIPLSADTSLALVRAAYAEADAETYAVPLGLAHGKIAKSLLADPSGPAIARLKITPDGEDCVIFDAMGDVGLARRWLELIAGSEQIAGQHGRLVAERAARFDTLAGGAAASLEPKILAAEQSNSSIRYGDRLILKLFRRSELGLNPDVEVTGYLTGPLAFAHVPPVAGTIEYRRPGQQPASLAVLQGFVANQGDAWRHTLARLDEFFQRVGQLPADTFPDAAQSPDAPPLVLAEQTTPTNAAELIGPYLAEAELLGQRTAELHLALATNTENADFRPEPFTPDYQNTFYQSNSRLIRETFSLLAGKLAELEPPVRMSAERLLALEMGLQTNFHSWLDRPVTGLRTRVHGDYHLGQVLWTGNDFVIIDFEGEPARSMAERRLKQSPLRDVAGMLRSFHYATYASLAALPAGHADPAMRTAWARVWHAWSSAAFLRAYLAQTAGAAFLPQTADQLAWLLGQLVLEKAVYELRYELNNRPDWLPIPLEAVLDLASR